jgi:hypothetical protein
MDVHALVAERKRVAEELRSTLTCLSVLRASLIESLAGEGRQHLLSSIEAEMNAARELGDKLLKLDASIQEGRQREVAASASPVISAPLDF